MLKKLTVRNFKSLRDGLASRTEDGLFESLILCGLVDE